jgi:hypothetical protein
MADTSCNRRRPADVVAIPTPRFAQALAFANHEDENQGRVEESRRRDSRVYRGEVAMSENNEPNTLNSLIRWGLLFVAGVSVACAVLHACFPGRFDEKTAMFLAVAVVALVVPQITKFKGFGIEFEKEVQRLKDEVKNVGKVVGGLEKSLGPGSKSAVPVAGGVARAISGTTVDPDDPNKGQFGGAPQANGRRLSAKITPLAGLRSARCRVTIRVESTDPARPLTGKVKLYLHPTFGDASTYELDVVGGVAEDNEIVSYGAFTIGAEADGGTTKLELDLMDVPGGTTRFYEQ